jgi:hypothetical protein
MPDEEVTPIPVETIEPAPEPTEPPVPAEDSLPPAEEPPVEPPAPIEEAPAEEPPASAEETPPTEEPPAEEPPAEEPPAEEPQVQESQFQGPPEDQATADAEVILLDQAINHTRQNFGSGPFLTGIELEYADSKTGTPTEQAEKVHALLTKIRPDGIYKY